MTSSRGTVLCIAGLEKGHAFLEACKREGWTVILLTSESINEEARWPLQAIDELYTMPDIDQRWDRLQTKRAVSWLARTRVIDRIVPFDDLDLEVAAMLREHLRMGGLGDTATRLFRDKLAMRMVGEAAGFRVPEYVHILNNERIAHFVSTVPPPWLLKPRFQAGTLGIRRVASADELWRLIEELGDERSNYLAEKFVVGDICHVDSLVWDDKVCFARASRYGRPLLEVAVDGDCFISRILPGEADESRQLLALNAEVLKAFGMRAGASHTEIIRGRDDGRLYFLETSARVAGAHLAEMVEAATGINLWAEWAKIELAGPAGHYEPPQARNDYAGIALALAKQEHPDTSAYTDPEIVWRLDLFHHVGFIIRSPSANRIEELLASLSERVRRDFLACGPRPKMT